MIRVLQSPDQTNANNVSGARTTAAADMHGLLGGALWAMAGLPLLIGTLFLATIGRADAGSRALLLAHFGLFLLWQPFFSRGASVRLTTLLAVAGGLIAAMVLGGQWFVVLWMCVLIGILGGRISGTELRRTRTHLLGALFCLLVLLLFRAVPALLSTQTVPEPLLYAVNLGLPVVLAAMLLLRPAAELEREARGLDFFYSLLSFQLAVSLVLGTLVATSVSGAGYFEALLITVFTVALALLALALLWNPSHGFSGLRSYLSRYILSVGVPFEGFLQDLAARADRVGDPQAFMDAAIALLEDLPWVRAAGWRTENGEGHRGPAFVDEPLMFAFHDLQIMLQTINPATPAVVLHVRLLTQLIAEFHAGKCRELQLRQNAYMQAVHETGARLTHDIKNLLQSLVSLTSAGQLMEDEQAGDYARMVKRQLPLLSQRLQGTLEKLRAPSAQSAEVQSPSLQWWSALETRYLERGVKFIGHPTDGADRVLPRQLFDSVAENLLDNALRKRALERDIAVILRWVPNEAGPGFEVEDGGSAVPQEVVQRLFLHPASTMKGLGIGLMQAAAQARQQGYRLSLLGNRGGQVIFRLQPAPESAASYGTAVRAS